MDSSSHAIPATAAGRRRDGRLYPLGIGLGLLIAFEFTQCPLVVMCDTTATTRTRRELGTRHSVSD